MDPSRDGSKIPPPVRGRARGRTSAFTGASPAAATGESPTRSVAGQEAVVSATLGSTAASPTHVETPAPGPSQPHKQMKELKIEEASRKPKYTYRFTRPDHVADNKQSPRENVFKTFDMVANCFEATVPESWMVHQYAVSFEPPLEDDQTRLRKALFRNVVPSLSLPTCLFDGLMLFTTKELPQGSTTLKMTDKFTNKEIEITIDCHKLVNRREAVCFQIYNIFVRKALEYCKLVQMGRRYFDPDGKSVMQAQGLEVWPGFATSLRYFENSLLLNVELVHKVINKNSVYHQIKSIMARPHKDRNELRGLVEAEIEGHIVLTQYNNHTYPVEKILWDEKVTDTFPWKDGTSKDYVTYYKEKYGINLQYMEQPLLLAAIKERDQRRRSVQTIVKLVPEICFATGLTDAMRSNFNLMKALGDKTHVKPTQRVISSIDFMKRLTGNDMIKEEMKQWQIQLNNTALVPVLGKQLKPEEVHQGSQRFDYTSFSKATNLRAPLHDPKGIDNWYAVVPKQDEVSFKDFVKQFQTVSKAMKIPVKLPKIRTVDRTTGSKYLDAIEELIKEEKAKLDLVFIVLPNTKPQQLYSTIKQKLAKEWGISSQCCLGRNLSKGLSVATKIAVQICCKVGGVPWIIRNPFSKDAVCVMGFDVYHSGGMGGKSYGAIVATTNQELSKTCSFVKQHNQREEISLNMGEQIKKCLLEYKKVNSSLPTKIFFYRDGVGEGQVDIVYDIELESAKEQIEKLYKAESAEGKPAQLTYVIVSKRINTRYMVANGRNDFSNPPPGTVVDDVITLHYRYDFFLVSQTGTQGSISPTNYNVIYDENKMDPFKIQTFTFKLCHNYYNWTGTLSVPSVCQNAHKLAYITGEAIKGRCGESLRHLPYYL